MLAVAAAIAGGVLIALNQPGSSPRRQTAGVSSVVKEGSWTYYEAQVACKKSGQTVTATGSWTPLGTSIMWSGSVNRRYGFVFEERLRIFGRSRTGTWVLLPSEGLGMSSGATNSDWKVSVRLAGASTDRIQCRILAFRAPTPENWFGA